MVPPDHQNRVWSSEVKHKSIYLDHNASTPPAEEVVEAMLFWLGHRHSNPHSEHRLAQRAAAALEEACSAVADLIEADPRDITFTSGATESNNLILQGLLARDAGPRTLAVSSIEHKSVLETAYALGRDGVRVISIPVDASGMVDPAWVKEQLKSIPSNSTTLVSVMHANNEIGTIQPIREIAKEIKETGALLHSDATQSLGKIPIRVHQEDTDFLSISSHKIYGPGGIGAVYIAPGLKNRIRPMMYGGGQQHGLRPGTVPVFLAVGFGVACRLASQRMMADAEHSKAVVDRFLISLNNFELRYKLLGSTEARLPGLLSLRLPGVDASNLVLALGEELYASTGSACTAGELHSSHVLRAIGLVEEEASEVIRLGFGRGTSMADGEKAAGLLARKAKQLSSRGR